VGYQAEVKFRDNLPAGRHRAAARSAPGL